MWPAGDTIISRRHLEPVNDKIKMYKEYKILKGSEIRGSQLRLPRAITIHKAALLHPCVTVNSCIRNSADAEIIILTLHRLSIPDEPVYPIQEVEEIAVFVRKRISVYQRSMHCEKIFR